MSAGDDSDDKPASTAAVATPRARRRARKEAQGLLKDVRRLLKKFAYRIPESARTELEQATTALHGAVQAQEHDRICEGLVRVDELSDRHLAFARKSTLREYTESIAVAVLIALLLRAFV